MSADPVKRGGPAIIRVFISIAPVVRALWTIRPLFIRVALIQMYSLSIHRFRPAFLI